MKNINASIDVGFGFVLGKSNTKEIKTSSYITKLDKDFVKIATEYIEELSEDKIIVEYENEFYALGDIVLQMDSSATRYLSNNRFEDISHTVQMISALGLLSEENNFQCNLALGLPNRLRHMKSKLSNNTKGNYKIKYITKNSTIEKNIIIQNVITTEQPLSAIFTLNPNSIGDFTILSIDCGQFTCDGYVLSHLIPSSNPKDYLCCDGVFRVYNDIEKLILDKYRDEYSMYQVDENIIKDVLELGILKFRNQQLDVNDSITKVALRNYAQYILHQIENVYNRILPTLDVIIISGGISINHYFINYLSELLKPYKVNFRIPQSSDRAVVNGLFNIVNRQYKIEKGDVNESKR